MKIAPVLAASLFLGLMGCSSSTPAPDDGDDVDRGLDVDDDGPDNAPNVNPDGFPYPTDNIGTLARRGSTPGNRIANYKFVGYLNADKSGGLQPISLAQFYDPSGERYKIIHIQAAGVWCGVCQSETKAVVPIKDELEAKGAVWLVSIAEGPSIGVPAKKSDMDGWIDRYKSPYTHLLDSGNRNLGPFYDAAALPWNANIDATTMEILTAGTGGVGDPAVIKKEIDHALELADKSTIQRAQK